MVKNLIFATGRELFMIRIDGSEIFWNDKKSGIHRLYPTPDRFALRMGGSPTPQELEEYNMCKTEDELASFCIRDCESKGLKLVRVDG
jgi:hypothetical protein